MNNKLKIEITGKNPISFLKELIRKRINIYSLDKTDKSIQIMIDKVDYEKIKEIKTTYQIKITKRYGINKLLFFIKRNNLLITFFSIGLILIILLSNIVFQIEIIHPNKKIRELVKKDLEEFGLKKYHFKIDYQQKEEIKKKILEKEKKKIEWIEIDKKGTKYIVKVMIRKMPKKEKECSPRSIIAKKNAIIKKITASKGEIIKKQNDYVEKGDVLISGLIYNKETITSKTCATGKVYGETWYTVKIVMPKEYKVITTKKNKTWGFHYQILGKEKNFGNKFYTFEKKEYNIIDSRILLSKLGIVQYKETEEKYIKYTKKEIYDIATKKATKKVQKRLSKEEKIIDKKVLKNKVKNSKIEIDIFFKVEEDISSYVDISDINIEEENKKER